jgi:hypothetical protein
MLVAVAVAGLTAVERVELGVMAVEVMVLLVLLEELQLLERLTPVAVVGAQGKIAPVKLAVLES